MKDHPRLKKRYTYEFIKDLLGIEPPAIKRNLKKRGWSVKNYNHLAKFTIERIKKGRYRRASKDTRGSASDNS